MYTLTLRLTALTAHGDKKSDGNDAKERAEAEADDHLAHSCNLHCAAIAFLFVYATLFMAHAKPEEPSNAFLNY